MVIEIIESQRSLLLTAAILILSCCLLPYLGLQPRCCKKRPGSDHAHSTSTEVLRSKQEAVGPIRILQVPKQATSPLRILCIDGGGSKGIGVAKMLSMMEDSMQKPLHELYDFVIGSSIGAIVLVGTLVCRYKYEMLEEKFAMHMARFSKGQSMVRLLVTGSTQNAQGQMQLLTEYLGPKMNTIFDLAATGGLPMCITTTKSCDSVKGNSHLIRNYGSDYWQLGEAVLATSAFPGVSPPYHRDGCDFRDGALLSNNPALEAIIEAGKVWPGRPIACLHSIGLSGSVKMEPASEAGMPDGSLSCVGDVMKILPSTMCTLGKTVRSGRLCKSKSSGQLCKTPSTQLRKSKSGGQICSTSGPQLRKSSSASQLPLVQSVSSVLGTIADTSMAEKHAQSVLELMHPRATFRRDDLPLEHYGLFISESEKYKQIAEETSAYVEASAVYKSMLQDHLEYFTSHGGLKRSLPT